MGGARAALTGYWCFLFPWLTLSNATEYRLQCVTISLLSEWMGVAGAVPARRMLRQVNAAASRPVTVSELVAT